jgi:hypothetical protein
MDRDKMFDKNKKTRKPNAHFHKQSFNFSSSTDSVADDESKHKALP